VLGAVKPASLCSAAAYRYHCRGRCRAVNITKVLEELFVEELAHLQPTPGFMRLVKDRVLAAWREMQGDAKQRIAEIERKQEVIRDKLDRHSAELEELDVEGILAFAERVLPSASNL
jgi:hypothetical protein